MLGASLTTLVTIDHLGIQLLNAVFLGFVFSQISFLGHDAGHYQIARSSRNNELVGLLVNFLVAMDLSWWVDKHNRHHANPNQMEMDADIEVSVLAFTEEQALNKPRLLRPIIRYQAFLFFPVLLLSSLSLRFGGVSYLIRGRDAKYPVIEPVLLFSHGAMYLVGLYLVLGLWQGALFLLIHQAVGRVLHGRHVRPQSQGDAGAGKGFRPRFSQASNYYVQKCPSSSHNRPALWGPELPDRAPPVPQHAPQ